MRRATEHRKKYSQRTDISIHALLAESDGTTLPTDATTALFLSTLSLRRATTKFLRQQLTEKISIHALLAESDEPSEILWYGKCQISIHALLAESDFAHCSNIRLAQRISIHALLAESDSVPLMLRVRYTISIHALLAESDCSFRCVPPPSDTFLSTLSLRRATGATPLLTAMAEYFYPRSPCGERLFETVQIAILDTFLSTLSLRRATSGP